MKKLFLFLFSILVLNAVFAQDFNENSLLEPISETIEIGSIFDTETPLELTLSYDITSFIRNKQKSEYLDAELQIHFNEADPIVKNIRLKESKSRN